MATHCVKYVVAEILGEKNPARARRIAGDFAEHAPSQALVKRWGLKADGVEHAGSAPAPPGFGFGQVHHLGADVATA